MSESKTKTQAQPSPKPGDVPAPAPALKRLEVLLGEWTTEIVHPTVRPNPIRGRRRFEWLTKNDNGSGGFLVQYDEVEHPDFPDSVTLIGIDADAPADLFTYHYFDTRGVERIYQMSLNDGVWKLWREASGLLAALHRGVLRRRQDDQAGLGRLCGRVAVEA